MGSQDLYHREHTWASQSALGTARDRTGGSAPSMRSFGELEAAIMDRLWAADRPLSVRNVLEQLRPVRPIAYTTVMTVLDNLHRKGWLRRGREGRAYFYEPLASRESYAAGLMGEAFAEGGDRAATLVHFIEQLAPEEAAALRQALGEAQAG